MHTYASPFRHADAARKSRPGKRCAAHALAPSRSSAKAQQGVSAWTPTPEENAQWLKAWRKQLTEEERQDLAAVSRYP